MDLIGWSTARMPDLAGRTALVTGANSGIGLEASVALSAAGARVLVACRNPEKAAEAVGRCRAAARGASPQTLTLDLSDLASVRECATEVVAATDRLDILINNAGVMALPRLLSADGFELQFATNHLGHFALTGLVLPLLRQAGDARVVTVSSLLAARARTVPLDDLQGERTYDPWEAYHQSKLANLLFSSELDRRSGQYGWGLRSVAAHPGLSNTRLLANGPGAWAPRASGIGMRALVGAVGQSSGRGALPLLLAATSSAVPATGYFGPRGPGHLRGRPVRARPPKVATDTELAAGLWAASEELTGVSFPV